MDNYDNLDYTSSSNRGGIDLELLKEPEFVSLPSKGYFYSGRYKNIDKIKVNKISWEEENLLTTPSYYDNKTIRLELLKSLIVDKRFPIIEMPQIDVDAVLIWSYITLFGQEYSIKTGCSACEHKQQLNWHFTELLQPEYSLEVDDEIFKNSFFIANVEGYRFYLIPPPPFLVSEIEAYLINTNKKKSHDFKSTATMLAAIKKLKYKNQEYNNYKEILTQLRETPISLQSLRELKKKIAEIDLQVSLDKDYNCESCGEDNYFKLTVGDTFFGLSNPADMIQYREYASEAIDFLTFWGKVDSITAMKLPVSTRKYKVWKTNENLKILYPSK